MRDASRRSAKDFDVAARPTPNQNQEGRAKPNTKEASTPNAQEAARLADKGARPKPQEGTTHTQGQQAQRAEQWLPTMAAAIYLSADHLPPQPPSFNPPQKKSLPTAGRKD